MENLFIIWMLLAYFAVAHIVGKKMVEEGFYGDPLFVYIIGGLAFPITSFMLMFVTLDFDFLNRGDRNE